MVRSICPPFRGTYAGTLSLPGFRKMLELAGARVLVGLNMGQQWQVPASLPLGVCDVLFLVFLIIPFFPTVRRR